MKLELVRLMAAKVWRQAWHTRATYAMVLIMFLLMIFAAYTGWYTYREQNDIRIHYQRAVREAWEHNPDKHPHRMAHYGSFAFRLKHPLSVFDFGLESYTGNAVYLEAHKQNTVNFSEASFSTGLLRFGEISLATLLQLVLPLVIIVVGFHVVAADRENGTLRMLLIQGAGWKDIIVGHALGLLAVAAVVLLPVWLITLALLALEGTFTTDVLLRYACMVVGYGLFMMIVCCFTVLVSASSTSSKIALMKLLAMWLVLAVLLPRSAQALGSYYYPAPSKVEFETAIEADVLRTGDSHNPDDPHYKHLRDSVLQVHAVDSVEKLPFNYSGFVMREGERISSVLYQQHLGKLTATYDQQNSLPRILAWVNPFMAIRQLSMALSGTDFESYKFFQHEAEAYRYQLAQKMNELQMQYISNRKPGPTESPWVISREHWKALPDFKPHAVPVYRSLQREAGACVALVCWMALAFFSIHYLSRTAKAI